MPDLLESIMRPTDPVKEELRQKLFKLIQVGFEIPKIKVSTFLDSGIPKFSRRRPTQPSRPVGFQQEAAFHTPINPIFGPARGQIYEKMRQKASQAPKCWFLAPSGARNQHFENPRPQFPENPNIILGKRVETTPKPAKKS